MVNGGYLSFLFMYEIVIVKLRDKEGNDVNRLETSETLSWSAQESGRIDCGFGFF